MGMVRLNLIICALVAFLFLDATNGDFHLRSETGRWDFNTQTWLYDDATSPCIDAGDPTSDWTSELWPHGKRINMGAYGGTQEASMSLSDLGSRADFNCDAKVNSEDLFTIAESWLTEKPPLRLKISIMTVS